MRSLWQSFGWHFLGVLFALVVLSPNSHAGVWPVTNQWNIQWEENFATWVKEKYNEDFYLKGPYANIPTDCADAVYMARIFFAFENGLPFAIRDFSGGSKVLSQENISKFDRISDPVQRVKEFAVWVSRNTGTGTIPRDSYPIQINREYLRPGTIWARPRITAKTFWNRLFGGEVKEDPGHAEIVKEVRDTGAIFVVGSTVPREVRKLIVTSSLVFMPSLETTGFRNFIQPDQYNMNKSDIPGFSLEQFKMGRPKNYSHPGQKNGAHTNTSRSLAEWNRQVQARVALRNESNEETRERLAGDLCRLVQSRAEVVIRGEARRRSLGGSCMDASDYDMFSTPSRDKRIATVVEDLADTGSGSKKSSRLRSTQAELDKCGPIVYSKDGDTISLLDFALNMAADKVSDNPNVGLKARWGLDKEKSRCKKY